MVFVSDIIKNNIVCGMSPVLIPNKKLVMLFSCPECKNTKMVKFSMKGHGNARKSQCVCGYIKYSSTWSHVYFDASALLASG